MKFKIFILLIILLKPLILFAQNERGLELNCGYGYYESFSVGAKYTYKPEIKFGFLIGTNFNLLNNEKYYSATLENNIAILKQRKDLNENYKWYWTNKIVYWDMENEYYRFNVLSIAPAITRNIYVSEKIYLSLDIGPLFTIVLESYRKTFKEIGWPYHVMPNFKFQIAYKI
ncbi:MAG: hypothetical protein KAT68_17785 [Bacteroidales bacterium]|nr:hypothetical protein [Bacteroidales bacterium]